MLPAQSRTLSACCCQGGTDLASPPRRGWSIAASLLPLAVWLLLPKCPLCVASYLALWTGLGLSFTEAAALRQLLLGVSGILLVALVLRHAYLLGKNRNRLRPSQELRPLAHQQGSGDDDDGHPRA
jgi:hypothetical protein